MTLLKIELNSLSLNEMKDLMVDMGQAAYRGEQLFRSFNQQMKLEIEDIKILPKKLRDKLNDLGYVCKLSILNRLDSGLDETKKYLILLDDKNIIEAVLMKYQHGYSLCVSTQVGCKMGCKFCASTKDGMIRDLSSAEILNQVYLIEKDLNIEINNIVIMGSGEPLDNYTNTIKFINIIHDQLGHNMSYRNITLSTCGIVPRIYDLADENIPITLSISLHSPYDEEREKIMPIGKKYKLKDIIKACNYYFHKTKRRITFEYTLISGVNDRPEDLNELINLLGGLKAHINLIPLNPIKEYSKEAPDKRDIDKILLKLKKNKIQATIRSEKGSDISGSCGQLRSNYIEGYEN